MAALYDLSALLARPDVQYQQKFVLQFQRKEKCVRVRPEWQSFQDPRILLTPYEMLVKLYIPGFLFILVLV